MIVKFRKLHPDAVAPQRMTEGAAGFDLTASHHTFDSTTGTYCYDTSVAIEIPSGYVGLLFPRSSVFKTVMSLSNCVGVIDSDYRGSIRLRFYGSDVTRPYGIGDRIGQLVIMPIPQVQFVEADELSDTERGEGGFGSSGK